MTRADKILRQGFLVEAENSGEKILLAATAVVATVNHEPRYLEMLESGYLDKEPVAFEVEKGRADSTAAQWIDGSPVPLDLRGVIPALPGANAGVNNQITYNGVVRKIMKRHDAGDRWVLMTIRDNVTGLGRP